MSDRYHHHAPQVSRTIGIVVPRRFRSPLRYHIEVCSCGATRAAVYRPMFYTTWHPYRVDLQLPHSLVKP